MYNFYIFVANNDFFQELLHTFGKRETTNKVCYLGVRFLVCIYILITILSLIVLKWRKNVDKFDLCSSLDLWETGHTTKFQKNQPPFGPQVLLLVRQISDS